MHGSKLFFLFVVGFVGASVRAHTQPTLKSGNSFTLLFPNGADTLTSSIKDELRTIAREIATSTEPSFSVVCYNRKHQAQRGWTRGYKIITFLRDSASVPEQKLRLFYDHVGRPNMVLIRISTKEEQAGTNCGLPRVPIIK